MGVGHKSFFGSFFQKRTDSSFSEEKEAKRLLCPRGFGMRARRPH
jgi:hypothetical protein